MTQAKTIEVGTTYKISPRWKKSVEEIETFKHSESGKRIFVTVLWRYGEYYVTPEDSDEANEMAEYLDSEYNATFCVSDFANWEMDHTWDGCSEDLDFDSSFEDEDEMEAIREAYYEDGFGWLDENQYWSDDCEVYIHCAVQIEEVKENEE